MKEIKEIGEDKIRIFFDLMSFSKLLGYLNVFSITLYTNIAFYAEWRPAYQLQTQSPIRID